LDDLHHLEQETGASALLGRLIELAQAQRLRLLVTTRQKPALPALTPVRALGGLSLADTRDLLRKHKLTLPADLLHQLHAETEGNGQFLTLAIGALQRTDDPHHLIEGLTAAEDVERHLLALVNNLLTPAECAVLAAVAILDGYPASRQSIEAITEEPRVRDALLSLGDRYLLTTERNPTGPRYSTHALVQKFFYNGLRRGERQTLHRRAAGHFAGAEADPLQAALHYLRAEQMSDAAHIITTNLQHLIGQGRLRALQRILVRFRQAALDHLLWAAVCVAKGQIWALLGEREGARAAYDQARALLTPAVNAPVLRAELSFGLAGLVEQDSFAEARRLVQAGLAALGDADPLLAASLHIKEAGLLSSLGDYAAARAAAERGLALLPATPHVLLVAAHENLGVIDFYTGNLAGAVDHWTRGLAICRRLPHPFKMVDLLNNFGASHLVAGNWGEAGRLLEEGLAEAQKLGTAHHQALFHLNLGILRTWQGDDAAAEGHLQTLADYAGEYASNARYSLADLRLRQGRLAEAVQLLDEAATLITAAGAAYQWPELHRLRAQLLLAQEEPVAAQVAIQESLRLAREMRMARDEGIALGILGQVLTAVGATADADDAFRRSLELLADEPYEQARTQMAWGLAQQQGGATMAGNELLAAAAQCFAQLGAQRDLGRCCR
jgi:tetratricopeptide (TPR) repeat protein